MLTFFLIGVVVGYSFFNNNNSPTILADNHYSPNSDIAKNDGTFKYPSPMESDRGWGEAVFPWHIVDGIRERGNYWGYGLAFTGGTECYEDTCGWRQATIDFGETRKFNRVVIWHACDNTHIQEYFLQSWNDKTNKWDTFLQRSDMYSIVNEYQLKYKHAIPVEDTFPTIESRKIRYLFNNCYGSHGWITEFEVYCDNEYDRPECLVIQEDE